METVYTHSAAPGAPIRKKGVSGVDRLLALFFFFLPFQFALQPTETIDLPIGRALAGIIGIVWVIDGLATRSVFVAKKTVIPILFSFIFLCFFSSLWAESISWTFRKALFLLSYAPLFIVLADRMRDVSVRRYTLHAIVFGMTISAGIGIIQVVLSGVFGVERVFSLWIEEILPFFLGADFATAVAMYPSLLVNIGGETWMRATAFFPDPHMAAFAFGMTIPLAVVLAQMETKRFWLWSSAAMLLFFGDILTFSRGGILGLLVGMSMTLFFARASLRLSITQQSRRWMIGFIVISGIAFVSFSPFRERTLSIFSLNEGSNAGRIALWKEAVDEIAERPFLGTGLGNYPLEVKPTAAYREPIYAHNIFLDIAVELGIVGLVLFLLLYIPTFFAPSDMERIIRRGAMISLIIFLAHGLVENPLFSVHIFPLLLFLLAL